MSSEKRVAVVLAGCGVYDGSECHEAVFSLNHLSKLGCKVQCFAPDIPQMHVVNHITGQPAEGETRNVLVESGRICRGQCLSLVDLKAADYDAIVIPGGFGAAKNLCDVAVKGADMTVNPEVERVVKEFHAAKKPLGFCCISPTIAAKVLGSHGVELTLGQETKGEAWPYADTVGAIKAVGATHIPKQLNEVHVDSKNKVVTSPSYMSGTGKMHEIEESIVLMVAKTVELA